MPGVKPMTFWATIVALVAGAFLYADAPSSILIDLAELGGVIALFALVCAAEIFSIPKG